MWKHDKFDGRRARPSRNAPRGEQDVTATRVAVEGLHYEVSEAELKVRGCAYAGPLFPDRTDRPRTHHHGRSRFLYSLTHPAARRGMHPCGTRQRRMHRRPSSSLTAPRQRESRSRSRSSARAASPAADALRGDGVRARLRSWTACKVRRQAVATRARKSAVGRNAKSAGALLRLQASTQSSTRL